VSTLTNAGLVAKAFPVPSGKPVDTVTGQDPPPGETVEKGSKVRINVSSGPSDVSVPSVIGLPFDQASAALQHEGFAVSRRDVDSNDAADTVVDQSPSGSAPPGSTITLSVSKGPTTSTVPDVTSISQSDAVAQLKASGFKVSIVSQAVTDPSQDGIVQTQDPAGGTKFPPGTTVTIAVGKFSGTTTAPTGPP
jgi:serine/threonine-protein kinase